VEICASFQRDIFTTTISEFESDHLSQAVTSNLNREKCTPKQYVALFCSPLCRCSAQPSPGL
jgi:hypothetical protein